MVTRLMKSNPGGALSVARLLVRVLSWYSSSAICHEGTNVLGDLIANCTGVVAVITDRLLTEDGSEDKSFEEAVLRTVRQSINKQISDAPVHDLPYVLERWLVEEGSGREYLATFRLMSWSVVLVLELQIGSVDPKQTCLTTGMLQCMA